MTPAERVHAVTTIANDLEKRHGAEVDYILEQFGVPTDERWRGDLKGYCIEMLKAASNTSIETLYDYVSQGVGDIGPGKGREGPTAGPWEIGSLRLFMSHISEHREELGLIKNALRIRGVDGFVAHADIEPSQDWQATILLALRTADALAAFLHPGFSDSKWTDQEVGVAVGRQIPIVPVVYERSKLMPYGFLGSYQALFARDLKVSEVADRIVEVLLDQPATKEQAIDALVVGLERSPNYDHANRYAGLLDKITDWTPNRISALERSLENRQVREAFVAGPKVTTLLNDLTGPPF